MTKLPIRRALLTVLLLGFAGCNPQLILDAIQEPPRTPRAEFRGPPSRPFYMGFTPWPADLTVEGLGIARDFAQRHGDILAVSFINGIPWQEAYDRKPFSVDVQTAMDQRLPAGTRLFLAISPLDRDKRGLAPYWGDRENMALPSPWNKEPLNSTRVRRAYANFVLKCIERMRPDYLAIGVEANVMLARNASQWKQYKELHRATYLAIKSRHPTLPVFFTTDVLYYRGLTSDGRSSPQQAEVAELMRYSDLFAMHFYPHLSADVPRPVPLDFVDFATRFKKPIAVAESGMTAREITLLSHGVRLLGSPLEQRAYLEWLLAVAARDEYEFVINFATTDSERLVARLRPPLDERALLWAYTGLQSSDRRPKPALEVWDAYFRAPYLRR